MCSIPDVHTQQRGSVIAKYYIFEYLAFNYKYQVSNYKYLTISYCTNTLLTE